MPTYEYACTSCGHEWEFEQSIKADPLTDCPHCHKASAKRQISRGTGFILKGSGWYSDLYSSSSNKKADTPAGSGDAASTGASTAAGSTATPSGSSSAGTGTGTSGSSSDSGSKPSPTTPSSSTPSSSS